MSAETTPWLTDHPIQLVLFSGSDADSPDRWPEESLTLWQFYRKYFRPERLTESGTPRKPKTIQQYDDTLRLWVIYTGDPPLRQVDGQTCAIFERGLSKRTWRGKPLGAQTQRKHITHLQAVLSYAGPRSVTNRRAPAKRGYFGADVDGDARPVPILEKPPETIDGAAGVLGLGEIDAWLRICGSARRPSLPGLEPPVFHAMLIVFLYNTALRIETGLAVRWDMIHKGWLHVPRELMKGGRRSHRVWLNHWARQAILTVRRAVQFGDGRLFPWPHSLNYFHAIRREMVRESDPSRLERLRPHGLRKAILTFLQCRNGTVAKLVSGHATGDVLLKHYTHRRIAKRLLSRLPQPKWVKQHMPQPDPQKPQPKWVKQHMPQPDPQKRLF